MVRDYVEETGEPGYITTPRGGAYIIVEFDGLYDIDKITTRRLNYVSLSMEFYLMSDLATGNGLSIRQDMVSACTSRTEEQSQYEFPQEKTTAADRILSAGNFQEITSAHYCLRRRFG